MKITDCWKEVKTLFQTFQEWFNDLKLYHYVGYLLSDVNEQPISKITISELIKEWTEDKTKTKENFIKKIQAEIAGTLNQCKDFDKQYETSGNPKTQCRPILLLHNIQSIIKQNNSTEENTKYKLPVFYKFPFHLFKKESWDVEHIDSHTENPLKNEKDQKEWLKYSYDFVCGDVQTKIKLFLQSDEKTTKQDFGTLYSEIIEETSKSANKLEDEKTDENNKTINEKDKLWNFCLLDSSTNRGYGNAIFPAKRRVIIGKDQGKMIWVDDNLELHPKEGESEDSAISFIPPCTKNVFLKYYNPATNNLREWDKNDAQAYRANIKEVLKDFLS